MTAQQIVFMGRQNAVKSGFKVSNIESSRVKQWDNDDEKLNEALR